MNKASVPKGLRILPRESFSGFTLNDIQLYPALSSISITILQLDPSPPQTPAQSTTALPPHSPAQS